MFSRQVFGGGTFLSTSLSTTGLTPTPYSLTQQLFLPGAGQSPFPIDFPGRYGYRLVGFALVYQTNVEVLHSGATSTALVYQLNVEVIRSTASVGTTAGSARVTLQKKVRPLPTIALIAKARITLQTKARGFQAGGVISAFARVGLNMRARALPALWSFYAARVVLQTKLKAKEQTWQNPGARVQIITKVKPNGVPGIVVPTRVTLQAKGRPNLVQVTPQPSRASQVSPIAAAYDEPSARASQVSPLTVATAEPSARASQITAGAAATAEPSARASQLTVTGAFTGPPRPRATQLATIFVFRKYYQPSPPLVYPELPGLTYSLVRTPIFPNMVGTHQSGREARADFGPLPDWKFELTYSMLRDEPRYTEYLRLLGFHFANCGSNKVFLFRNPVDCEIKNQTLYTTLGPNYSLYGPIYRTIGYEGFTATEPVGYVNTGAGFKLYLDGEEVGPDRWTLIQDAVGNQLIKFYDTPPAGKVISVDMSYYYACRFDAAVLQFEEFLARFQRAQQVTLIAPRPRISLTANLGIMPNDGGGFGFVAN